MRKVFNAFLIAAVLGLAACAAGPNDNYDQPSQSNEKPNLVQSQLIFNRDSTNVFRFQDGNNVCYVVDSSHSHSYSAAGISCLPIEQHSNTPTTPSYQ